MYFDVLLPGPFKSAYTYSHDSFLDPGTLVQVDLRGRKVWGVVDKISDTIPSSVKPVLEVGGCINCLEWIKAEATANHVPVGIILKMCLRKDPTFVAGECKSSKPHVLDLSEDQIESIGIIQKSKGVILLQGVTGSGKTEVYFHSIDPDGQNLILLPEIALTKDWKRRFREAFGYDPYVWHSKSSPKSKSDTWAWAISGKPGVVVGARSAVFLPLNNLKVVVIDEEQEHSYKQDSTPRYHARDAAIRRAGLCGAKVVLVSATPSVETMHYALSGKYAYTRLTRAPQHGLAPLAIHPIAQNQPMSDELLDSIDKNPDATLLLVNRRGYATSVTCKSCKKRLMCRSCSVGLAWHKSGLRCHWCDRSRVWPKECSCGGKEWVPYGWGLERVYEWIKERLPHLQVKCVSSDTPKIADTLLELEKGDLDLVIGTQVISQGHNLSRVSLVAILDSFYPMDFRAYESLFQLIVQTRGRAGRVLPGKAWWETQNSYVSKYIEKVDEFYKEEIARRKDANMPPFSKLTSLIIYGKTNQDAQKLAAKVVAGAKVELWGPGPAPVLKIRGLYRWRILIRGEDIAEFIENAQKIGGDMVEVDVNPYTFY